MNAKQKLLEALENLPWNKDTDSISNAIFTAVHRYMRDTSEYSLDIALNGVVHKSTVDEMAIRVIEQSGLEVAIRDFLNVDNCDYTRDYYWHSGFGDIRNLEISDLEKVVKRIKKLEDLDDGDEENDPGNKT